MFKVKLIQKTRNKNGDSKREVKSEKQIKKNDNYQSLINELSKIFNIPINKIILMVLTEDEDEYPINDQEDLDSYIDEAKEFLIIYEIDSIQNKKDNFNILAQVNFPKKELTLKGKDNKLYNLMIINEQDEIIFKSNAINNIWDIQYSINVNIKGFYEINKIFRKYNSINEIYSKYFNDIEEEQIDISSSGNKIVVYFSDKNGVKIPFILEPNEMKMDKIIRKLCDRMEDIEIELDIQKIENTSLKKELERRINDDEKNISELKKEIENLKKSINSSRNQEELYDNKFEDIIKEIKEMKNDIDKLNKNKIEQGFQEIIEESKKSELIGRINDMILDDDDYHQPIFIEFEKDEIKYEINNKKSKYFEIKNIKITNIGDKEYNELYFVIDTNNSSKNLLFNNIYSIDTWRSITLDGPFQKGKSLNNNVYFIFKGQEFKEYILFIYVRENINGENLSLPLKIIAHLNEDPEEKRKREETEEKRKREESEEKRKREEAEEKRKREEDEELRIREIINEEIKIQIEKNLNIDLKGLDKEEVYQMYKEINEEFNVVSIIDDEKTIEKIIEYNCDRNKIVKWIEDYLFNL